MKDELPEGWTDASVIELSSLIRGVSYAKGEAGPSPASGRVALLRANNIGDGLNFDDLQYVPQTRVDEKQRIRVGDVVLAMSSGSKSVVGKAASVSTPWDGTFGAFCGVLRPDREVDAGYFGLYFQTKEYRAAISDASAGTNINNLKREYFEALRVPLPPLAEQKRIVAKVEELLARVNAARERLAKAPALLKRFRQSVLAAACSGQLTAEWRESIDMEQHSAHSDLAEWAISDAGRVEPAEENDILIRGLPAAWCCSQLGDLFSFIDYRGRNPNAAVSGKRLITAKNIKMGYLSDSPVTFVSDETYARWMTRGFPRKGDILFVTEGATMGFVAINTRDDSFALAQRTITLQAPSNRSSKFFFYVMLSREFQELVRVNATGSAAVGIKAARLRALRIPFPSLPEQHEIVRRVEALFALADKIEARVQAATLRVEKITQAILAKAFRGELVPTEAELARHENRPYEPASLLLDRIRAARNPEPKPARLPGSRRAGLS